MLTSILLVFCVINHWRYLLRKNNVPDDPGSDIFRLPHSAVPNPAYSPLIHYSMCKFLSKKPFTSLICLFPDKISSSIMKYRYERFQGSMTSVSSLSAVRNLANFAFSGHLRSCFLSRTLFISSKLIHS